MTTPNWKRISLTLLAFCLCTLNLTFAQTSTSSCLGDNLLLYNSPTGAGVSGKITTSGFNIMHTYLPGGMVNGATQVSNIDGFNNIMLYDSRTGNTKLGTLENGVFTGTNPVNGMLLGWSNILYAGLHDASARPLFYDAANGLGSIGFNPTVNSLGFSPGWTHIAWAQTGTFFLNSNTGQGAIVVPLTDSLGNALGLTTTNNFINAGTWSHVTVIGSELFFYNKADGSARIAKLTPITGTANTLQIDNTYGAGYFGSGWTHVVGTSNNLVFFYNSATGDAAIVKMFPPSIFSPFPISAGTQFSTIAIVKRGVLPTGITHIVCSEDGVSPDPPA
jgi:hypothetical protein